MQCVKHISVSFNILFYKIQDYKIKTQNMLLVLNDAQTISLSNFNGIYVEILVKNRL